MKRHWIPVILLSLLLGVMPAPQSSADNVFNQDGMYECSDVDIASGEPICSCAQWKGCDFEDVQRILSALKLEPLWPSVFPQGYDPDQEPVVIIFTWKPKDDFAEFRVGEMLSSRKKGNSRDMYWELSEAAFDQPKQISLYFINDERSTSFCLRYNLWTTKQIANHAYSSSRMEIQENGFGLYAQKDYPWNQVYIINANDLQRIRKGDRSEDTLMIYYRLMSTDLDLETLKEIAINLVPYADVHSSNTPRY